MGTLVLLFYKDIFLTLHFKRLSLVRVGGHVEKVLYFSTYFLSSEAFIKILKLKSLFRSSDYINSAIIVNVFLQVSDRCL